MESKSRATAVGIFVLTMVLMLIGTVLWFTQDRTERVAYDIITSRSVGGVLPQAAVELYGLNVGKVESVSFVPDQPGHVRIRLQIEKNTPINQATYAMITSRGVTGASFVSLVDDETASLEKRTSLLMDRAVAGDVPMIELRAGVLDSFTEGIAQFSKRADELLENLNHLISNENGERLISAIDNVGSAAEQIAKLSATINDDILGSVGGFTTELTRLLKRFDNLVGNVNTTIADLRKPEGIVDSVTRSAEAWGQAANRLNQMTLPNLESTVGNFYSTLRAGQRMVERLEDQPSILLLGEGASAPAPGEPGYQSPYRDNK